MTRGPDSVPVRLHGGATTKCRIHRSGLESRLPQEPLSLSRRPLSLRRFHRVAIDKVKLGHGF
jgi:hypothetical protein